MGQKKNILIFIDWFLPGTASGGPVRSYANLIAHLGDRFNFYVITRDTDYCETEPYKGINSNAWNTLSDGTKVYYVSQDRLSYNTLKAIGSQLTFDTIYINGLYSWYFSILPLWLFRQHPNRIVAARGMLNPQAFSVKPFKKHLFLTFAKALKLYQRVTFHATNQLERDYISHYIGADATIDVAPNLPRVLKQSYRPKVKSEITRFVCVARISVEKGTLTMLQAFKSITSPVVLDLYGPIYDMAYWEACKVVMAELPPNVTATYKGSVEGDAIPQLLQNYDFFVMLSEGENFGHAILEALSAGCPVVISDKTPWVDLQAEQVGWDLPTVKIEQISQVIRAAATMDAQTYKAMSQAAYNYAQNFCKDPLLIEANLKLFGEALDTPKHPNQP